MPKPNQIPPAARPPTLTIEPTAAVQSQAPEPSRPHIRDRLLRACRVVGTATFPLFGRRVLYVIPVGLLSLFVGLLFLLVVIVLVWPLGGSNAVPGSTSEGARKTTQADDWLFTDPGFCREVQERKTVEAFFREYPDAEEESDDSKPEIGWQVYKVGGLNRYGFLDDRLIWKMVRLPAKVERAKDDVAKAVRALGQPRVTTQREGQGIKEEYVWMVEERDMGVHYLLYLGRTGLPHTDCIQHLSCGSIKWLRERNRRADQLAMPDR
jgi:hypothetical protein